MARKKKTRKTKQKPIQTLNLSQQIQAAEAHVRSGAPKAAIDILRFATKRHGLTPELKPLLFRAHLEHADELAKQGRAEEAEAVAGQASPMAADVSWLSEEDLLGYVSRYAGPEAFETYSRYVRYYHRVPEAENRLAGHLFRHRRFALVECLDAAIPMAQEAGLIREAVSLMDEGAWEDALERLRPLPRKSPFAPIRLLCRAMSDFYAEKDADAVKALSMIPGHFPLAGVAARLKDLLSLPPGTEARQAAAGRLPALWEGPVHLKTDAETLARHLEKGDIRAGAKTMQRMAESACPENPSLFSTLLLQIAWSAVFIQKLEPEAFLKIAGILLPPAQVESLYARMMMTMASPFVHAGKYLTECLSTDFPDAAERDIAHAAVLLRVVRQLHWLGVWEDISIHEIPVRYRDVLGTTAASPEATPVEMTARALTLDPSNREGYQLLADLPRPSRKERKTAEKAFLAMCDHFPEDPFPCLGLASVYYENHAFRKAEHILEEAMRRAPHDNRVVDKYAVSLLIASEKNVRRGKFHLAAPDIDRAGMLASRGAAPYVAAKRMRFTLINPLTPQATLTQDSAQLPLFDNTIDFSACLEREIQALSGVDRLRMLAFLIPDLEHEDFSQKKSILKLLVRRLKEGLKPVKAMPAQDLVRLLSPLGKDYAAVFHRLNPAPFLLKHEKNLLGFVRDGDHKAVYDLIMAPETFAHIQKDIRKRLKKAGRRDKIILSFYLAGIRHLSGQSSSYGLFLDILHQVDDAEKDLQEELRGISRRLSRHAAGHLRHALSHFQFGPAPGAPLLPEFSDENERDEFLSLLQAMMEGGGDEEEFLSLMEAIMEEEDEDEEDFGLYLPSLSDPDTLEKTIAEFEADPASFVPILEEMIDELDLWGAPDGLIRNTRHHLQTHSHGMRELFNQLSRRLDPAGPEMAGMRRECFVLLYGKRPVKKSRKRKSS